VNRYEPSKLHRDTLSVSYHQDNGLAISRPLPFD